MVKMVRFTKSRATLLLMLGGIALVFFVGTSGFFFWKSMHANDSSNTSGDVAAQSAPTRVIDLVNTLYKLPTGEEPTVAKVQDKGKLIGQAFFKDVQNGDYVLIYKNAKIALLYRESENRLINVGPVSLTGEQPGQTAGASTKN